MSEMDQQIIFSQTNLFSVTPERMFLRLVCGNKILFVIRKLHLEGY